MLDSSLVSQNGTGSVDQEDISELVSLLIIYISQTLRLEIFQSSRLQLLYIRGERASLNTFDHSIIKNCQLYQIIPLKKILR